MKNISDYISEGFFSNIGIDDCFNTSFDNIYDFAKACTAAFNGRLDKPIKISDKEVVWKHIHQWSNDGIYVQEHFEMSFNGGKYKLRVGVHGGMLIMQKLFKDHRGKTQYCDVTFSYDKESLRCGYIFKSKQNFREWINTRSTTFDYLRKIFT